MAEHGRHVVFHPGPCTGCGACSELAPDYVAWREGDDRPYLLSDATPDTVLNDLVAFCPEGCFEDEEAQQVT